ncbi:MAG TPA: carbonic anhydrase [Fimbriimonas sp.]
MTERATEVLQTLLEGNERFRTGRSLHYRYEPEEIARFAVNQKPIACVIACSDSRVSPEIVFDQPLGNLFTARIPGNVCADSGRWTIDIAVSHFKVPLVMVLGHTGCLAVGQIVDGQGSGEGGPLRLSIMAAVYRAQAKKPEDLLAASIEENASLSIEQYTRDSYALRTALSEDETECVAGIYDIYSGQVRIVPQTASW